MARPLTLAAYFAKKGKPDQTDAPIDQPPRPDGSIVWARCSNVDQLTAVETLGRKLAEDGDPIHMIATLTRWDKTLANRAIPEPIGKQAIDAFLHHWRPACCVWVGGEIDARLIAEISNTALKCFLVDATADALDQINARWIPGVMRSILSQFDAIFAIDYPSAARFIREGARADRTMVTGAMEDCSPTLPCNDAERNEVAQGIGPRPVWLVAAACLDECDALFTAHHIASRRAHRLLLIVVPDQLSEVTQIAACATKRDFKVALRSQQYDPTDVTQVYIVDTEEELGLWYRIAPITFLGGSLTGTGCRDPFEPASLGSAVIHGGQIAPFEKHAARLNGAGASSLIRSGDSLGTVVESLLSANKAAEMAHLAWDVTSSGASVTNKIADLVQLHIEGMDI